MTRVGRILLSRSGLLLKAGSFDPTSPKVLGTIARGGQLLLPPFDPGQIAPQIGCRQLTILPFEARTTTRFLVARDGVVLAHHVEDAPPATVVAALKSGGQVIKVPARYMQQLPIGSVLVLPDALHWVLLAVPRRVSPPVPKTAPVPKAGLDTRTS